MYCSDPLYTQTGFAVGVKQVSQMGTLILSTELFLKFRIFLWKSTLILKITAPPKAGTTPSSLARWYAPCAFGYWIASKYNVMVSWMGVEIRFPSPWDQT